MWKEYVAKARCKRNQQPETAGKCDELRIEFSL